MVGLGSKKGNFQKQFSIMRRVEGSLRIWQIVRVRESGKNRFRESANLSSERSESKG